MAAMIFILPPHFVQVSTSMLKTLSSRLGEPRRRRKFLEAEVPGRAAEPPRGSFDDERREYIESPDSSCVFVSEP